MDQNFLYRYQPGKIYVPGIFVEHSHDILYIPGIFGKCSLGNSGEYSLRDIPRILNIRIFRGECSRNIECRNIPWMFIKKLSQLVPRKRKEELSIVTYGIRCKLSFALLRSCLICIRGSRKSSHQYEGVSDITFAAIDVVKRNEAV